MLMNPCLQAAREAKEGAAKAADEAESKGDVVKQEKVEKIEHAGRENLRCLSGDSPTG